eukprot:8547-Heterococcus_DN1.PRE.1
MSSSGGSAIAIVVRVAVALAAPLGVAAVATTASTSRSSKLDSLYCTASLGQLLSTSAVFKNVDLSSKPVTLHDSITARCCTAGRFRKAHRKYCAGVGLRAATAVIILSTYLVSDSGNPSVYANCSTRPIAQMS